MANGLFSSKGQKVNLSKSHFVIFKGVLDPVLLPYNHNLFLEILSQYANRLIFSIYNELYRCKETNWKQKNEETPRMQTRDNKN